MIVLAALVAVNLADWAERSSVEPIAVTVEFGLNKIFVPADMIFYSEFFSRGPGVRFNTKQGDVASVICVMVQAVAELVQELKVWAFGFSAVKDGVWGLKSEALALFKEKLGVIGFELFKQGVEI